MGVMFYAFGLALIKSPGVLGLLLSGRLEFPLGLKNAFNHLYFAFV
jgi:hypothetical protein